MLLTRTIVDHGAIGANTTPRPQLTSMVDMLTILLVFLLKSFSVEGNLATADADIQLADSTSNERPVPMINVVLSTKGVSIDGLEVVALEEFASSDSMMIPGLHEALAGFVDPLERADGDAEVTIQCDRQIDFAVVKKVMFTCAQAGYEDFSLLVAREG